MHMRLSRVLVYRMRAHNYLLMGTVFCFYPRRDAMLARVLAMALCPCLSLSVISRCSIKRNERINLLFGMKASFDQSCAVI